jgi:hypothetical protein
VSDLGKRRALAARGLLLVLLLGPAAAHAEGKVAALDYTTRGIKPQLGSVYSERFALFLRKQGVTVTTSKDLATVLSLERQKQLLGCADASTACMSELVGALGVEALVTGQLAKVGKSLQLLVKLVDARSAATIFSLSRTLKDEEEVLEALEAAAPEAAVALARAFPIAPVARSEPVVAPPPVLPVEPPSLAPGVLAWRQPAGPWVLTSLGGLALGVGGGLLLASALLVPAAPTIDVTPSAQVALEARAQRFQLIGAITAGAGAAVLTAGLVWLGLSPGPQQPPAVSLWLDARGGGLQVGAGW